MGRGETPSYIEADRIVFTRCGTQTRILEMRRIVCDYFDLIVVLESNSTCYLKDEIANCSKNIENELEKTRLEVSSSSNAGPTVNEVEVLIRELGNVVGAFMVLATSSMVCPLIRLCLNGVTIL
ncbi:hypothetical protein L2E82_43275 [Cichorium intybus]|uniref:Uncharacterized protein n=1 Tax=Cichorium intybus TaxID=13427 RepID=A0ACB8ZNG2_CICIN|nr:hypothetical protein L2E82_43275 [Cichorium intybus]